MRASYIRKLPCLSSQCNCSLKRFLGITSGAWVQGEGLSNSLCIVGAPRYQDLAPRTYLGASREYHVSKQEVLAFAWLQRSLFTGLGGDVVFSRVSDVIGLA